MAAKRADHVICVSESTRRDAVEIIGLPIDKTSVIHHGYNLMNANSAVAGQTAIPPGGPFLLYVGSRGGYKNFSGLLAAYGASPKLRKNFRLICFGGSFQPHELQRLWPSDLVFTKWLRSAETMRYLKRFIGQPRPSFTLHFTRDSVFLLWKPCRTPVR